MDSTERKEIRDVKTNNDETTATAIGLTKGFHSVTVTDGVGCENILEVFIDEENTVWNSNDDDQWWNQSS